MEEEMDIENPKNELLTSSDSDSDSEDDNDKSLNEQLKALESDLAANPSNYDSLLQYIKLLRKMGEIDKLREARENMSAVFPLTPDMWQEWAKDEVSLSSGAEAFSVVEKLYERGVCDYPSVPLWCDYLNFVQENDPSVRECSPEGISKARNLFERALTAAGLHVAEGYKIWDAYREFEQAILLTIDEADSKAKEMQIQQIQGIFHRQLSVPLLNLKSTLLAYKAWEAEQGTLLNVESDDSDGVPSHVASAYKKAVEMLDARLPHEEGLSKQDISDPEKLQEYMNYLKYEKSVGDPARVQVLYERAITTFPVSSDLWLDYTSYMDRTLKIGKVVRDVYSRATKNCPWVGELWARYLLSLERGRGSEKDISTVFDKSLQCTFSTIEEYLDLFMTRVDGLRRRISSGNESEGEVNYSSIRETFQYASDYLSPHLKNTEAFLQTYAYWARLELNLGKDLAAARKVWESLLKTSGSMLESWKAYIAMEIEWGHINEARAIYKRCYSKRFPGTGSEDVCRSWLRFEREFGTLEDLDRAVQKVGPRLEELKLYQMQQEAKETIVLLDERDNSMKRDAREKRKGGSKATDEQSPAKRQKGGQTQKEADVTNPTKKQHNVNTSDVLTEANSKEKDGTHDKPMENSDTKRKVYRDQCTAFISNLNLKTIDEDLCKFFGDDGGVLSVRVMHDRNTGKSRGFAYVDFSDDEHLAAALAKNKQILHGRKLSILRSNPKQNKKDGREDKKEHGHAPVKGRTNEGSGSTMSDGKGQAPNSDRSKVDNIELKGKNIFAVPRNVRRLGLGASGSSKPKTEVEGDEAPKSNDEFRKMFIKEKK